MLFTFQDKRKTARRKEKVAVWIDENFRRIYNERVRAKENRALCELSIVYTCTNIVYNML